MKCVYTVWRILSDGPQLARDLVKWGEIFKKILILFFLRGCDPEVTMWVGEKGCRHLRDVEQAFRSYESGKLNGPLRRHFKDQVREETRAGQPGRTQPETRWGKVLPGPI